MRRITATLFLDIKGVYDNVAHHAILDALQAVGIGRHVFRWIRRELNETQFFVLTEDGPTPSNYTSRVVPQGGRSTPPYAIRHGARWPRQCVAAKCTALHICG